ncbi:MAG: type III PLP-dependent enzyme [Myxococcales bacterium]|nr:type III PLP-dependent enzyme [Myxococcales bacterium]
MSTPARSDRTRPLLERLGEMRDGELVIEGHAVSALAERVGTPLYVYRSAVVLEQVQALRAALGSETELYFSIKANPSVGLCQVLARAGVGAELASIGELRVAQAASFAPEHVLFAGPGKTERELTEAVRWGIGAINVESLGELTRVIATARRLGKRQTVCLRINPREQVQGAQMRMGGGPTQFGLDEELMPEAVRLAAAAPDAVDLAGLHVYAGSQMTDVEAIIANWEHVLGLAEALADLGVVVRKVDLGGGFGVPYFEGQPEFDLPGLGRAFASRIAARARSSPKLAQARLIIELGRYLCAAAGLYVTRVLDVKESRGTRYVVTDGGMNHHITATGNFGQVFRKAYPMVNLSRLETTPAQAATVVGPCCTPLDQFGTKLNLEASPGELVGVLYSGAYGLSASSQGFLSHPTPAEVLIHEGRVHVLREGGAEDAVVTAQRPLP